MDWKCRVNLDELSPKLIDLVGQIFALRVNPKILTQIFTPQKSYNTIGCQWEENFANDVMDYDGEHGENLCRVSHFMWLINYILINWNLIIKEKAPFSFKI